VERDVYGRRAQRVCQQVEKDGGAVKYRMYFKRVRGKFRHEEKERLPKALKKSTATGGGAMPGMPLVGTLNLPSRAASENH
jgi:hypothetical protein